MCVLMRFQFCDVVRGCVRDVCLVSDEICL